MNLTGACVYTWISGLCTSVWVCDEKHVRCLMNLMGACVYMWMYVVHVGIQSEQCCFFVGG